MDLSTLQLERLNKEQLKELLDWAKAEGWNPGPHDLNAFWAADPEGYYGYFHEDKLIAGGSIVSYNGEFGFMGLFIVKEKYRAFGIGRQLWHQRRDMLLSRLKPGASIGMDGVVDMQPFYEKGGFKIAFRDERYEKMGEAFQLNESISSISKVDLPILLPYDKECFGFKRETFLKEWISLKESKSFKYKEGEKLKGFVVARKAHVGYKIGPLFAHNETVAEELYKACLNACQSEPVYLDIPINNPHAAALIKKYKAKYVFECARMYYNAPPNLKMNDIFGVTTFELG